VLLLESVEHTGKQSFLVQVLQTLDTRCFWSLSHFLFLLHPSKVQGSSGIFAVRFRQKFIPCCRCRCPRFIWRRSRRRHGWSSQSGLAALRKRGTERDACAHGIGQGYAVPFAFRSPVVVSVPFIAHGSIYRRCATRFCHGAA
jgi:hypothetical protein